MNSTRSIVRMLPAAVLCLACGALAVVWPGWRATLRAQTYYHDGGCMTGGGSVGDGHVTHGFVLHCNVDEGPNTLEVNWGRGNKFHLEQLTSASCSDDPNIQPDPARAGFDTYDGAGTGRYNGKPASAEWTFTDQGKSGDSDFADIVITDSTGNVLSVSGTLSKGEQQAHRDCGEDSHGKGDSHDRRDDHGSRGSGD